MSLEIFSLLIILTFLVVIVCWKGGYVESLAETTGAAVRFAKNWFNDMRAVWDVLPEKLSFRAYYGEFLETKDRRLWTVVEIIPVATDGFSVAEWNKLGSDLNRVFCPGDYTTIQVIHFRDDKIDDLVDLLESQATKYQSSPVAVLSLTQAELLKNKAAEGALRNSRTFVFIGRQVIRKKEKVPLFASILSSERFVDLEVAEFNELAESALRARDEFIESYTRAGGWARRVNARTAFEITYQRLNPARARKHPAPACTEYLPWQLGGTANSQTSEHYDLFAENPRETLCFSYFEIKGSYIYINDEPHATVSLHRLPVNEFPGMVEKVVRSTEITFPFQINLHYEVGSRYEWQDILKSKLKGLRRSISQSGINPDGTQIRKNKEYTAVQDEINESDVKLGHLGISINLCASNLVELKARVDLLINLLRAVEGFEADCDQHNPLPLYLSSLPGNSHSDFRRRPTLSRTAAFLAPLTNGPRGLPLKHTTEIFSRADGEAFRFSYDYREFNNLMSVYIGEAGSGKSTQLNYQRLKLAMRNYIGLTFDFGSSAPRVVAALGGTYLDATKTPGLGLFNIFPQPDEVYQPDELNDIGLPKQRLTKVEFFLEMLALNRDKESELPRSLRPTLRQAIYLTYDALMDEPPIIDDFISTLRRFASAEGDELAERLSDYAANETLGGLLNDKSTPLSVNQYVVFDFKNAKGNPRLRLVATLAAMNYLERFLAVSRNVKKFFDVDELNAIVDDPLICKAIDEALRTARKRSCIVSVASQDPADFTRNEHLHGIRSNCKIQWLFNVGNIEIAKEEFGLSNGEVELARLMRVSGSNSRDCLLRYPAGERVGCVHLRLQLDPLTAWLCAGAGNKVVTKREVFKALEKVSNGKPIHPNLYAAIDMDALGENQKQSALDREAVAV